MILEAAIIAGALGWTGTVWAASDDAPAPESTEDDPLSPYRTPFRVLTERTIGVASQPVEFDWRRTRAQVAVTGHQLFELNNYDSLRVGLLGRFPVERYLLEAGVGYVFVGDTPSSGRLALTPYRQPGRPARLELDFMFGLPLAEGVVTTAPRWFPAVELVLMAYVGVRYAVYPGVLQGLTVREGTAAVLSPRMSDPELANLEERRLPGMQIDRARYGPMVAIGNDVYFTQGLFLSPRFTLAVPLLAAATESELRWWGDATVAVGMAF